MDPEARFAIRPVKSPTRPEVERDRDRLIHSAALRRLGGKSQIMSAPSGDYFRTRLTHSLECAQIGRAIASRVKSVHGGEVTTNPEDFPTVVEVGCLSHDLGHPPFGHNGENALDHCMQRWASRRFEGNAQSLRVATWIEPKVYGPSQIGGERWLGLDLTRASLQALMKYTRRETEDMIIPGGEHPKHFKFGVFRSPRDLEYYDWIWKLNGDESTVPERSIAAAIVDTADDIAYAVHDLEDGIWAGMIPLRELVNGNEYALDPVWRIVLEREQITDRQVFDETIERLLRGIQDASWVKAAAAEDHMSRRARSSLKTWASALIDRYIHGCTDAGIFQEPTEDHLNEISVLKALAWRFMIDRPDMTAVKHGQRQVVEQLFDAYWNDPEMLPERIEHQEADLGEVDPASNSDTQNELRARLICDHIASMTDRHCLAEHGRMFGGDAPFVLRM